MGIRLTYNEVPKDDIKTAIIEDYPIFQRWYESIAEESPEEPNYDILECLLTIDSNKSLFDQIPDKLINDFVDAYLDFCDYGPGKLNNIKDISNPYSCWNFCFLSEQECRRLLTELSSNFDENNTETHCAITATIQAIENKKGLGMLVIVG